MAVSFDTLAAAEAMESAGVEHPQARAIAAQLHAAASAGEAVTRPGLEAALGALKAELLDRTAALKAELLDRIAESERGLVDRIAESERGLVDRVAESERGLLDRIAESERGLVDRIAESERRTAALLWRLFGGMVAVAGATVAVLKYLP